MLDYHWLQSFSDWLLWTLTQNLLVTATMVPIVLVLCYLFRTRPAVQHLLWLIVLLKFITPSLPGISWQLPEFAQPDLVQYPTVFEPSPAESLLESSIIFEHELPDQTHLAWQSAIDDPQPNYTPLATPTYLDPYLCVLAIWFVGAIVLAAMQTRKTWRYYRMVRRGAPAAAPLSNIVNRTFKRMGLRRLDTRVVARISSPFLCCLGRVRLAWPQALLDLDETSIAVITAHEAAHLRRKDHWVAWLELAASIVWWWNPVFWFVRRQLRNAAELSCDAVALEAYPEDRGLYAETLLWLSAGIKAGAPPLQLAIGSGAPSSIERRIHMIATDHVSGKLSVAGVSLAALLVLGSLPGWSFGQNELELETGTADVQFTDKQVLLETATEGSAQGIITVPTQGESGVRSVLTELLVQAVETTEAPALGDKVQSAGTTAASSSLEQQLLRIKAMQLIAQSENRTADAEALATAIRMLESSPEVAEKLSKANHIRSTDRLYSGMANPSRAHLSWRTIRGELVSPSALYGSSLRGWNSLALRRKVTGSNVGTVWGSGIYTDDSLVAVAAVHAGLVKVGETKEIVYIVEPGMHNYTGGERNGISTSNYGAWAGSYRLASIEEMPGTPYFCTRAMDDSGSLHLQSLKDQAPLEPGTTLVVPVVGSTTGVVWGSGTYTADSSLDTAAVHAGVVAPGESGLCKVTILKGRDSYDGSTANGITTSPYNAWGMSFQLDAIPRTVQSQPEVRLQ